MLSGEKQAVLLLALTTHIVADGQRLLLQNPRIRWFAYTYASVQPSRSLSISTKSCSPLQGAMCVSTTELVWHGL